MQEDAIATEPTIVTLGGAAFRVVNFDRRTVLMDHYLAREIRAAGIDKVMPMDGDSNAGYLIRIQTAITDSGRACNILAGYLLPSEMKEQEWTPKTAERTARHIGRCNTQEDRELVSQLCIEVAFGFFKQGLRSLELFRSYFQKEESSPSESNEKNSEHST